MCVASFRQSLGGIVHAIVGGGNSLVVVTTLQFGVGGTQASTVKGTFNKDVGQGTWDTPIPKSGNDVVPSDRSLAVGTCVQAEEEKVGGEESPIRNINNDGNENVKNRSGTYQVQVQQHATTIVFLPSGHF